MLSHPGPDKNHVNLMHWLYRKKYLCRQVTLVFTADYVKNDVSLCVLDVNVKVLTAYAGIVGFFKLELKLFKGKVLLFVRSYLEIKCWKSKGMQEKVSVAGVWCV